MRFLFNLIPHICVLCRLPSQRNEDLCLDCAKQLPYLPADSAALVGVFRYETPVDNLIAGLKFHDKLFYADLLGNMLVDQLKIIYQTYEQPEVIIPVPLHPIRLRERGFNQAVELARPIAKKLKLKIDLTSCKRVKHTSAQSLIHADERHANIKNAFAVVKPISYKHVAIIDDVVTTGSTVLELSKALREAGVEKIDTWCIAKTQH
jgi:ComF family protein